MRLLALALVVSLLGAGCAVYPQDRRRNLTIAATSAVVGVGLMVGSSQIALDCDGQGQDQCDDPGLGLVIAPLGVVALIVATGFVAASVGPGAPRSKPADVACARAIEDVLAWSK